MFQFMINYKRSNKQYFLSKMGKGQTVNFLGQTVKLRETDKYESIVGILKKDGSQER